LEVALVTAYTGKEHRCVVDLMNALIPYDPEVRVVQVTKASFIIDSKLNPNAVLSYLKLSPPNCAAKAFPIHLVSKAVPEDVVRRVSDYVNSHKSIFEGRKFYADCIVRSGRFPCREVELGIGMALRDVMKVDFDNPDYIIYVNVVKEKAYISIIQPSQEKLSVYSLR